VDDPRKIARPIHLYWLFCPGSGDFLILSIAFCATFDRSHSPTKLKVASRINRTLTNEVETSVADPNPPSLPLEL
jgi:hypothetical protein